MSKPLQTRTLTPTTEFVSRAAQDAQGRDLVGGQLVNAKFQIDCEAIIEDGEIICEIQNYEDIELVNNVEYEFDIVLSLVSVTETLAYDLPMYLKYGNDKISITNILSPDINTDVMFGQMQDVVNYDSETGFRWIFDATYNKTENTQAISITPTVNKNNNVVMTLTNQVMLDAVTDGEVLYGIFKVGQVVTPSDDDGYALGHLFQYTRTGTIGNYSYDWTDITSLEVNYIYSTSAYNELDEDTYNLLKSKIIDSKLNIWVVNTVITYIITSMSTDNYINAICDNNFVNITLDSTTHYVEFLEYTLNNPSLMNFIPNTSSNGNYYLRKQDNYYVWGRQGDSFELCNINPTFNIDDNSYNLSISTQLDISLGDELVVIDNTAEYNIKMRACKLTQAGMCFQCSFVDEEGTVVVGCLISGIKLWFYDSTATGKDLRFSAPVLYKLR